MVASFALKKNLHIQNKMYIYICIHINQSACIIHGRSAMEANEANASLLKRQV